ncbi:DUF5403 family protein [Kineococcus esterisolvens]|uniref:DUF5403 family protein n=1 Tax=unclassified Kineococcus TaxID=2621656 RepID=UPI003D7D6A99
MAHIYERVGGRKFEKAIALNEGVQADLEQRTFLMAARAEELLVQHHADGDSEIDVEHGDVDYYVILSDERGQDAALSIEYGRAGYIDQYGNEWGEMEGLYILHRAAHLSKRGGARVPKLKVRRNAKRNYGD